MRFRTTGWHAMLPILLGGLLLAGCSTTIVYNHADSLLLWQLDRYFDLTRAQRQVLSERLDAILARHRREALPQYESFLIQVQTRVARGLTGGDIDWFFAQYDRLRADLFGRFAEDGTALIRSLDDAQVRHLQEAIRNHDEQDDRLLRVASTERLADRADRTLAWLTEWVGELTPDQRREITRLSLMFPDMLPGWLAHQRDRRKQLLVLVQARRDQVALSRGLRAWLVDPDRDASPEYVEAIGRMRQGVKQMALSIDHSLTPEQRRHATGELRDVIQTVRDLQVS